MKKEYYFFFIFVIAAATLIGSTIAVISNMGNIINHHNATQTDAGVKPDKSAYHVSADEINIGKDAVAETDYELMVVSDLEQQQIDAMLKQLGKSDDQDKGQFISEFQQLNSLPPTGTLDSKTLHLIITQVTLNQASRAIGRI
ncbi:MAG: peptidoglycan-binding domain-containing protein [Syntrophomonadaceae bacterium]|nr:peptidoglycan-binding domain-containing protein [Syntrophomonadaceae bacterium]